LIYRKILPADVLSAYEDFSSRTLARIPGAVERLIYIASTRDYNSGLYHHEGLASRFSACAAAKALQCAHAEAFQTVSAMPLRQLSQEIQQYMKSSREESAAFLNAWQKLEPYRVAIPMEVDATIAELFVSNVKIALAILRVHLLKQTDHPSGALRRPSPGPRSLPQLRN
jgi:hypothetical protein